jgi:hypothetical protein
MDRRIFACGARAIRLSASAAPCQGWIRRFVVVPLRTLSVVDPFAVFGLGALLAAAVVVALSRHERALARRLVAEMALHRQCDESATVDSVIAVANERLGTHRASETAELDAKKELFDRELGEVRGELARAVELMRSEIIAKSDEAEPPWYHHQFTTDTERRGELGGVGRPFAKRVSAFRRGSAAAFRRI